MPEVRTVASITRVTKRIDRTIDIETYFDDENYPDLFVFIADDAENHSGVSHNSGDLVADIDEFGMSLLVNANGSIIITAPEVSGFAIDEDTGQLQYID